MGNTLSEIAVASPQVLKQIKDSIVTVDGARISELVENAQLAVLHNAGEDALEQAANRAKKPGRYSERCYNDQVCLQAYLLDYFTENVLKMQLILHDLLLANKLPTKLDVLDVGVGTGTTEIAILDFLRILADACSSDDEFPITELRIVGIDRLALPREFSQRVVREYAYVLESYIDKQLDYSTRIRLGRIVDWAKHCIAWDDPDFSTSQLQVCSNSYRPNLIVASNVRNEMNADAEGKLQRWIGNLPDGGIAVIIEPRDDTTSTANTLGSWFDRFLRQDGDELERAKRDFRVVDLSCFDGSFCDSPSERQKRYFEPHWLYRKARDVPAEARPLLWRHIIVRRSTCMHGQGPTTQSVNDSLECRLNEPAEASFPDRPRELLAFFPESLEGSLLQIPLASDVLERLLRTGNRKSLSDLLFRAGNNCEYAGESRIRNSATFFHKISSWRSGRETGIDLHSSEDFIDLRQALRSRDSVERADMVVAVIQAQRSKFSKTWKVPLQFEAEALCDAWRLDDADAVADRYRELTGVELVEVNERLERLRRAGRNRSVPGFIDDYKRIFRVLFLQQGHRSRNGY